MLHSRFSYHFIAHIFADTIMVDRDAAIRHLRHYPLRREVKGITRALVESLLRAAPPESSVADKAAAVPLCERSPQDEKLVFRIPGAFWEGRPDAAVRDAMKEKYPLSVIAYVLLYWCGPQNPRPVTKLRRVERRMWDACLRAKSTGTTNPIAI